MRVLNNYGTLFAKTYTDNNSAAGYEISSALNSITFQVSENGGTFELTFNLPDYWKYAENGRGPGKMPPEGSLLKWMEWKRILPSPMTLSSGRTVLPSMDSLEYLIRRKIGKQGTQGSHTWELTEQQMKDRLISDVKEALTKDIMDYLNQLKNK